MLKGLYKVGIPHKLMFSGPSGCGKTTLARILARKLDCDEDTDFCEINCADTRGIDMVRDVKRVMGLSPMAGSSRVWLMDEAHKLTNDAQTAMLKMIEEPPKHVYFILATTDPNKLIRTIQTRLTNIAVGAVPNDDLENMLTDIYSKESETVPDKDVLEKIVELADGSVRQAIKLLESVIGIDDPKKQLHALERQDSKRQAIEIARELFKYKPRWPTMAKILKDVDEDPEKIRHMILGYANAIILKNLKLAPRAAQLIELFRDHYYDCGKSGLYASVFLACTPGK